MSLRSERSPPGPATALSSADRAEHGDGGRERRAVAKQRRRATDTVRAAVRDGALWKTGDVVVLACSGGRDSIAGLALLADLRLALGHQLVVGHIDHQLRNDGEAVAHLVRTAAARFGVVAHCKQVAVAAGPQLEARARTARYAALQAIRAEVGGAVIATAHHADDQAETLLMRLSRGAGADALRGIASQRDDDVVRPMLALDGNALKAVAIAANLDWIDDPSNVDTSFTRNHMRHVALPALEAGQPGAARGIVRSMRTLADAGSVSGFWVDRFLDSVAVTTASTLRLPRSAMPNDAAVLGPLVRSVALRLGVAVPGQRAATELARACGQGAPCSIEIAGLNVMLSDEYALFAVRHVA